MGKHYIKVREFANKKCYNALHLPYFSVVCLRALIQVLFWKRMCAPQPPLPLHYLKSIISFLKHTYSHLTLTDSQIDRQPAHRVSSKPMNHNRKGGKEVKSIKQKEIRDGKNTKHLPVSVIVVFQTTRDSVCLEMTSCFLRKLPPALAKQTYIPESCILQQLWQLKRHLAKEKATLWKASRRPELQAKVSLEKVAVGRKQEGKSFLGHFVLMLALCCLFNSRVLREREREWNGKILKHEMNIFSKLYYRALFSITV